MGDKKTFIEINGKRYDARSGHLLDLSAGATTLSRTPLGAHGSIDGFSRRPGATPQHQPDLIPSEQPSDRMVTRQTPHDLHRSPQKSQTLMRPAVSKPSLRPKKAATRGIATNQSLQRHPPPDHATRFQRAETTPKSRLVSRFHQATDRSAPATSIKPQATPAIQSTAHTTSSQATPSSLDNRLERAISSASSHLQKPPARKKRVRPLHIASSALAVGLLIGFFAFQNLPNFQMRLAASKAGFAARFPGYQPAGFGIAGPIKSEPGSVAITFKSRTDNRFFSLRQHASDWNSDTLLHSIQDANPDLQTYHQQGKTIYIYDGSNATWVDGGVRYEIAASSARLSQDQLQRLASSF